MLKGWQMRTEFTSFSSLAQILVVYNFACSLTSLYSVVFIIAALAKNWPHSLFDISTNDPLLRHALWVYYMTKYIELLDTVFMILRHRQRQMTLLHVSILNLNFGLLGDFEISLVKSTPK